MKRFAFAVGKFALNYMISAIAVNVANHYAAKLADRYFTKKLKGFAHR